MIQIATAFPQDADTADRLVPRLLAVRPGTVSTGWIGWRAWRGWPSLWAGSCWKTSSRATVNRPIYSRVFITSRRYLRASAGHRITWKGGPVAGEAELSVHLAVYGQLKESRRVSAMVPGHKWSV